MCTHVVLFRPGHAWPLLLGANRDELVGRPWRAPGRHWPDRPGVTAGRDDEAGGTWLGLNDEGVVAGLLNRVGSLGPAHDKKSRGILPLLALDHGSAEEAADAITRLQGSDFKPFNMLIADSSSAWWVRWGDDQADGRPTAQPITEGLHMLSAFDLDDPQSPRVRRHLPKFRDAAVPGPDSGDWTGWIERLCDTSRDSVHHESGAVLIEGSHGFATVSSSLIALAGPDRRTIWQFASGRPDKVSFVPVPVDTTDCV